MSGYKRDIVIRVVPVNGAESVYWFNDCLTDLGMHVKATVTYPKEMKLRQDINRTFRPVIYAKRCNVQIEVFIATMADQWFLQEIEEALDDPRNYAVFLSLDGGVVEREIVWDRGHVDPVPKNGRTIVGATFVLSVQAKYPIPVRGPMMTDPGTGEEFVSNGGFEEWSGGIPAGGWNGSSGVGTVAQETTIVNGGASSAKVTRSDGSTSFLFYSPLKRVPKLGAWFRYRGSVRSSIDLAETSNGAFRVALSNLAATLYVAPDGKTWTSNTSLLLKASLSSAFTMYEAYFRMPTTIPASDTILLRHQGYWASGESLYYDDDSVYGPVLRPGVATW